MGSLPAEGWLLVAGIMLGTWLVGRRLRFEAGAWCVVWGFWFSIGLAGVLAGRATGWMLIPTAPGFYLASWRWLRMKVPADVQPLADERGDGARDDGGPAPGGGLERRPRLFRGGPPV